MLARRVDENVERPKVVDNVKSIISEAPKNISQFSTEPIENFFNKILMDESFMSIREAFNVDLTDYILLDLAYRWANAGDAAINVNGRPNKGKSNILLWLMLNWCRITGKPFKLSNIVFNSAEFNLLLKGIRVIDKDKHFELTDFKLTPGMGVALDEAADITVSGPLSMTIILQTTDIENRMRALQVGRFCAGVREILHGAYYSIYVVERDSVNKMCYGLVKMHESTDPGSDLINLGFVKIPYVDKQVFDAYNAPKKSSIHDYGRGGQVNKISRIVQYFARQLSIDEEFQKLPLNPPIERLNYIQRAPLYTIFTTQEYFSNLEKMSRNLEMHYGLNPNCICSRACREMTKAGIKSKKK
jgi:hypothetical protein